MHQNCFGKGQTCCTSEEIAFITKCRETKLNTSNQELGKHLSDISSDSEQFVICNKLVVNMP